MNDIRTKIHAVGSRLAAPAAVALTLTALPTLSSAAAPASPGIAMTPAAVSAQPDAGGEAEPLPEPMKLTEPQQQAVNTLTARYLEIQTTLAADETAGLAEAYAAIGEASQKLDDSLDAEPAADDAADPSPPSLVVKHARALAAAVESAPDEIEAARDQLGPISAAMIELVKHARPTTEAAPKLHTAHCPMVDADWLQSRDEIVNPYMGSRMLRCGTLEREIPVTPAENDADANAETETEGESADPAAGSA